MIDALISASGLGGEMRGLLAGRTTVRGANDIIGGPDAKPVNGTPG